MTNLSLRPRQYRQFGDPEDATFVVVTNPRIASKLIVDDLGTYRDFVLVQLGEGESFPDLLKAKIPEKSHVLVISPDVFFASPSQEALGKRKLLAMACNSTPTSIEQIAHFLGVIERTDPYEQARFAKAFFDRIEDADFLTFVDGQTGTTMRFDHLADVYEWNQQAGPVDWGEQQIAPSGEISVLPIRIVDFDADRFLRLNGQVTFYGRPILHSGSSSSLRADQSRLYEQLAALSDVPVICDVEDGRITDFVGSGAACTLLKTLGAVDSRYSIIWEIGFALNTALDLVEGNCAMNEVYGGKRGAVHFGLGLTPFTQYHLDIICPHVSVVSNSGVLVHGSEAATRTPIRASRSRVLGKLS